MLNIYHSAVGKHVANQTFLRIFCHKPYDILKKKFIIMAVKKQNSDAGTSKWHLLIQENIYTSQVYPIQSFKIRTQTERIPQTVTT